MQSQSRTHSHALTVMHSQSCTHSHALTVMHSQSLLTPTNSTRNSNVSPVALPQLSQPKRGARINTRGHAESDNHNHALPTTKRHNHAALTHLWGGIAPAFTAHVRSMEPWYEPSLRQRWHIHTHRRWRAAKGGMHLRAYCVDVNKCMCS
jgi:hypothetical protein